MGNYIGRRALLMIPTLIGITMVVFMMVRFLPGDVVDTIAGDFGAGNKELRDELKEQYQLTGSIPSQYVEWIWNLVRGDLGESIVSGRGVEGQVRARSVPTLQLAFMTIVIGLIIGLPIGILSATRRNSASDYVGRTFAIGFLAIPGFWLATLLITLPSRWWGWSPPLEYTQIWEDPMNNLRMLIFPAIILSLPLAGTVMRLTRAQMLEVLRQDYIRTAWAKGLNERKVIGRHALRNALIPVVTVIGLQLPVLFGGVVIMESIFGIPGMGSYLFDSIVARDYPIVQGVNLLIAVVVLVTNLAVDVSYGYLDPRIRHA